MHFFNNGTIRIHNVVNNVVEVLFVDVCKAGDVVLQMQIVLRKNGRMCRQAFDA